MSVPGFLERPAFRFYQLAWSGLDWLYPPRCGGCNQAYSRWCSSCQRQVQLIRAPLCECCGKMTSAPGICPECQHSPPPFTALRSWAVYQGPLRNAILLLKYAGDLSLGEILARPLLEMLQTLHWGIDLVIPVPISLARKRMRGYNQASMLALPIALGSGVAYRPQGLMKVREAPSQVGLTAAQRRRNVQAAFQAQGKIVAGKTVLVVDDITTSGATMEACSNELLRAGACRVFGLTLARTVQEIE